MKATLEFNLDDKDDRVAHQRAVKSLDLTLALWRFKEEFLLPAIKYGEGEAHDIATLENVLSRFDEELNALDVNLDELIL